MQPSNLPLGWAAFLYLQHQETTEPLGGHQMWLQACIYLMDFKLWSSDAAEVSKPWPDGQNDPSEDLYLVLGCGAALQPPAAGGEIQCNLDIHWGSIPEPPPGYQGHHLNGLMYDAALMVKSLETSEI